MMAARWIIPALALAAAACSGDASPGNKAAMAVAEAPDVVEAARLLDTVKCFDDQALSHIHGLLTKAVAEAKPKTNVRALVEMARYRMVVGSSCTTTISQDALNRAQFDLRLALTANPESADALIQSGRVETHLGHYDDALEALRKAEALGSHDAQLHVHRGMAYTAMGNWKAADESLRKVPRCQANHVQVEICGGRLAAQAKIDLYNAMDDQEATLRAHREAVESFPESAFMRANLANFLLHTAGDIDGAMAEARKGMEIRPNGKLAQIMATALYAKWAQLRQSDPTAAARFRQEAESAVGPATIMAMAGCGVGNGPAMQTLITAFKDEGLSIDTKGETGNTALTWAATCGKPADMRWLLAHGASPEVRNDYGETALSLAVWEGRADSVEVLLPIADLETQDKNGDTPLLLAAIKNRTAIAVRLIGAKANINHANGKGVTALITAAMNGNEELARALMQAGADLKPRSKGQGLTAAEWAELLGHRKLAELIGSY